MQSASRKCPLKTCQNQKYYELKVAELNWQMFGNLTLEIIHRHPQAKSMVSFHSKLVQLSTRCTSRMISLHQTAWRTTWLRIHQRSAITEHRHTYSIRVKLSNMKSTSSRRSSTLKTSHQWFNQRTAIHSSSECRTSFHNHQQATHDLKRTIQTYWAYLTMRTICATKPVMQQVMQSGDNKTSRASTQLRGIMNRTTCAWIQWVHCQYRNLPQSNQRAMYALVTQDG